MSTGFYIGQKVVCVKQQECCNEALAPLVVGAIYTIRDLDACKCGPCLDIGQDSPEFGTACDCGCFLPGAVDWYDGSCFRPYEEHTSEMEFVVEEAKELLKEQHELA